MPERDEVDRGGVPASSDQLPVSRRLFSGMAAIGGRGLAALEMAATALAGVGSVPERIFHNAPIASGKFRATHSLLSARVRFFWGVEDSAQELVRRGER